MDSRTFFRILGAFTLAALVTAVHAADVPALFPDPKRPLTALTRDAARQAAERRDHAGYRQWKWSLAPVIATQGLDVASSWGMRELNPALADPSGRFGMRAATLKLGAAGALLGVEYLLVKKHPGAARVLAKLNWSSAVVTGAFAAHNYSIK
jgi:hypothetical protein